MGPATFVGRWAIWLDLIGLRPKDLGVDGFSGSRALIWRRDSIKVKFRLSNQLQVVSWLIGQFHHSWKGSGFPLQ